MQRAELEQIIKTELELTELTPLIIRQLSKFRLEHGYSYKQIARAVVFLYQIKKRRYEPMFGIGSVPNIMEESDRYFERLRREREARLKSLEEGKGVSNIILKPKMATKKRIGFKEETED